MLEIASLRTASASRFAVNAEKLLTRCWSAANWRARRQLLKNAEWLIRLEKRRAIGSGLKKPDLRREVALGPSA